MQNTYYDNLNREITVSVFRKTTEAYITDDAVLKTDWKSFAADLVKLHIISEKKQVPLFNLWEFEGPQLGRKYHYVKGERQETYDEIPNTVRRCKEQAVACHGVVLDFDDGTTIDEAQSRFAGIEHVLYTTFSHTAEHHKFRVVMPFVEPISFDGLQARKDDLARTFGMNTDGCSFAVSQCFYLHSASPELECVAYAYHETGEWVDVYSMEVTKPVEREPAKIQREFKGDDGVYLSKILECLHTASGVRYSKALEIVVLVKSAGGSAQDFVDVIDATAASDSSLRKSARTVMDIWNMGADRMRAETRDALLASIGAKPYPKHEKKSRVDRAAEDLQRLLLSISKTGAK